MKNQKFQPVIGLEIHVELNTNSKMFCSCPNDFNPEPNVNICPVCLGHPGTLPVINKEAVRKIIKAGLALNCEIAKISKFDRKSYFYPDLPKGYQISQYDMPLCEKGFLEIMSKKINIRRIHLEEDAGKLVHSDKDYSLVDFNRAGVPLMELVTEPDIRSAEEAVKFAKELQLILRYLKISDADMEKGHMRIEVNISLSKGGLEKADLSGIRAEIKNLNSFKAVEGAIRYEIERQSVILSDNKKVVLETRGWDANNGITISQRKKEEAHDYRYLPDPDLPVLTFTDKEISEIKESIPVLPREKRTELIKLYYLKEQDVEFFVQDQKMGSFFEEVASILKKKVAQEKLIRVMSLVANYLITDVKGLMNKTGKIISFSSDNFAEFILLINSKKISSKIAKNVLSEMFKTGESPSSIIAKEGLSCMDGDQEIEGVVSGVLLKNPKAVLDFKAGKENVLQFLIGQVMAQTKGRADLKKVTNFLKEKIKD